jgi:hypothetical protein
MGTRSRELRSPARRAPRLAALCLAAALAAGAAHAEEKEEAEGWDPSSFPEANMFGLGMNGVLTAPADPFYLLVRPPEALEGLPGAPVTNHAAGFFAGTALACYRVMGGVMDMLLFLIPHATLSPEPQFHLVPGVQHPDF